MVTQMLLSKASRSITSIYFFLFHHQSWFAVSSLTFCPLSIYPSDLLSQLCLILPSSTVVPNLTGTRDWTQVSCIAAGSLSAEPQGKPKNTGLGSLSLLQWISLTHGSNWVLLHCRQILYELSYQRSPIRGYRA